MDPSLLIVESNLYGDVQLWPPRPQQPPRPGTLFFCDRAEYGLTLAEEKFQWRHSTMIGLTVENSRLILVSILDFKLLENRSFHVGAQI